MNNIRAAIMFEQSSAGRLGQWMKLRQQSWRYLVIRCGAESRTEDHSHQPSSTDRVGGLLVRE